MPFSHHSHSGQFCGHAQDTLEEVLQSAMEKKMQTLAFTEHMPRDQDADLYPEEIKQSITTTHLFAVFEAYCTEAQRLRHKYGSAIDLLIGLEIDWIRETSQSLVESLLTRYPFDLFIGSVHHVHTIPIDYSRDLYIRARTRSGGGDERLFEDYYDAQYDMVKALTPPIVGHFDLIRLKSDEPNGSFRRWKGVWERILRNLDFIVGYGGVLELNSAALRKDMAEPYPKAEICEAFLDRGGRFTLSDDSHGVDQVGFGLAQTLAFAEAIGVERISLFEKGSSTRDKRFPSVSVSDVSLTALKTHAFLDRAKSDVDRRKIE